MYVINNRVTKICGVFIILFVILHGPIPVAEAADSVEDWLEENNSDREDKLEEKKDDTDNPTSIDEKELESNETSSTSLVVVILKMVLALFLVLGLIYILLQFLKRKNKLFMKSNALENIGGITVGSNKSMQIVRIGSRFFVVGVGENVEILHEITDQEVVQDLLDDGENDQKPANRFMASLMGNKQAETKQNDERNFKQLFTRELRNLKQNRKKIMNENKEDMDE